MSEVIRITLIRSHIGRPEKHRSVLMGMGLNRLNKTVSLPDTPETRGMVKKVEHMVRIEE
ncbi:MAG: 50S ribosomal protein L30 [Deltaproteobacteria bacterium]|nr:50S ribosomal protein L30 [Deltaproteobacteria bacterium]